MAKAVLMKLITGRELTFHNKNISYSKLVIKIMY